MKKRVLKIAIGSLLILSMSSCMPFGAILMLKAIKEHNEIIVEKDDARSALVARAKFYHYMPMEKLSPLDRINQTIVKQSTKNEFNTFKVFDIVRLKDWSFPISQEVYIIVDGEAFHLGVDGLEHETITKIDELAEDMSTAIKNDRTIDTHSLNSYNQKVSRLSYQIDIEIIEQIIDADTVMLRYYAGPNMITVQFNEFHLGRLKKLISTSLNYYSASNH